MMILSGEITNWHSQKQTKPESKLQKENQLQTHRDKNKNSTIIRTDMIKMQTKTNF